MRRFRRFASFAIMLPVWPVAMVAAIVDDEAEVADIVEADKNRAVEIVRNCRIIAMEGAGDGK